MPYHQNILIECDLQKFSPRPSSVRGREFYKAITLASKVIEKRPLALLSHLLLKVEDGHLTMTGTNLQEAIMATLPWDSSSKFSPVTAEAPSLKEVARAYQREDWVEVRSKGGSKLCIGKMEVETGKAEDFPVIPSPSGTSLTIDGLKTKLERVLLARGEDEYRRTLHGVYFDFPRSTLVATNGHRMHLAPLPSQGKDLPALLLPAEALYKCLGELEDQIMVSPEHIFFALKGGKLLVRRIDEVFPEYTTVIPKDQKVIAEGPVGPCISLLERACQLSRANSSLGALVRFEKSKAEIGYGQGTSMMEKALLKTTHPPSRTLLYGVNPYYFLDALKAMGEGEMTIATEGKEDSPLSLTSADGMKAIVMPMRIEEKAK